MSKKAFSLDRELSINRLPGADLSITDRQQLSRQLVGLGSVVKFGLRLALVTRVEHDVAVLVREDGQQCRCLLQHLRSWAGVQRPDMPVFRKGDVVEHPKYGRGRVWFYEGDTVIAHFGKGKRRYRARTALCRLVEAVACRLSQ